jgi:hypothetical protein
MYDYDFRVSAYPNCALSAVEYSDNVNLSRVYYARASSSIPMLYTSGGVHYSQPVKPTWVKCPYCGKRNSLENNDLGECRCCGGNLDARVI